MAQVFANDRDIRPYLNRGERFRMSKLPTSFLIHGDIDRTVFALRRHDRIRLRPLRIESELPEGAPSQLAGDAQPGLRTSGVQASSCAPPGGLSTGRGYAATALQSVPRRGRGAGEAPLPIHARAELCFLVVVVVQSDASLHFRVLRFSGGRAAGTLVVCSCVRV